MSSLNATTSSGIVATADNTATLQLQTAGTNALNIDASQNVGIGTTSPSYKLDVRGNIVGGNGTIQTAITWDTMGSIGTFSNHGLRLITNSAIAATIDTSQNFQFNSGYGSVATAYGCRAWVNFNGTGTVAIQGSGNVSSVTDLGVGQYRANFTTNMPDANYAFSMASNGNGTDYRTFIGMIDGAKVVSSFRIGLFNTSNVGVDCSDVSIEIFR